QVLALLGVLGYGHGELGEADDTVEVSLELMAHVCEEFAFDSVGLFGYVPRPAYRQLVLVLIEGELDRDPELALVEGLYDVAVGARVLGPFQRSLVSEGRDEYDGHFRALAQVARGLDSVLLAFQLDVHEDEIGTQGCRALDGEVARFHDVDDAVPHALEPHPHVERDDVLVLDD